MINIAYLNMLANIRETGNKIIIEPLLFIKLATMKIFSLNKMGRLHDVHTEDHVFIRKIEPQWVVGAVMDGCSSGKETYFVSTLYGKIMQKSCLMLPFLDGINRGPSLDTLDEAFIGRFILNGVFKDLNRVHNLLATDLIEMLSTLILLVYNVSSKSAWINISGDGFIVHDQIIHEIDQNNIPDYIAYHLDIPFEDWISSCSQTLTFENQADISISTDGINKFYSLSEARQRSIDPVNYLLIDQSLAEEGNMLERKFNILKNDYGLAPYDDLGMIRIINS